MKRPGGFVPTNLGTPRVSQSQAGNITDLDLTGKGGPPEMVGLSAFTPGVGGGSCPACGRFANALHADGKCGKCTRVTPVAAPGTCRTPVQEEDEDEGCCGGGCGK